MSALRVPGLGLRQGALAFGTRALRVGGALCTNRCGRSSSDGGARRPGLDRSWSTANTTVLTVGQCLLINGPVRGQVRYRHLQLDAYRRPQRSPRTLDMVTGHSKEVFKPPLATQPDIWRRRTEIVAMDGFTGLKSATA